jgi:hypothetical protein
MKSAFGHRTRAGVGLNVILAALPNNALQRTRFAPLRSPLSRKPFGG